MSTSSEGRSLRNQTGAIRRLDAARARQIVALFARPVVGTHTDLGFDRDDPVAAAACGWVTLDRTADDGGAAQVVGHYQTHLYLDGLERLPLSVARQLVRHRGHLYLDALTSITDAVATILATHGSGGLSLNQLRRLSPDAARALGRHGGELSLGGLRKLAADVACGLAHHANDLRLSGLAALSPATAAVLSRHRGDLSLDGLEWISSRAAMHLARHGGKLHFHGLKTLTDGPAEAFGRRTGSLCLRSLKRLSPWQAHLLAKHRGPLYLSSLELDDDNAECLGGHVGSLVIRVPDDVPTSRLAALVQHRGPIEIGGIERLDARRAAVLAGRPCHRGIAGLSGLFLTAVRELTPAVAAILATHRAGELALCEIRSLTADVARELVKHPLLALDRVTSVTDEVAAILATHAGASLSLRSLAHASPAALAKLRANDAILLPRRFREPPSPGTGRRVAGASPA